MIKSSTSLEPFKSAGLCWKDSTCFMSFTPTEKPLQQLLMGCPLLPRRDGFRGDPVQMRPSSNVVCILWTGSRRRGRLRWQSISTTWPRLRKSPRDKEPTAKVLPSLTQGHQPPSLPTWERSCLQTFDCLLPTSSSDLLVCVHHTSCLPVLLSGCGLQGYPDRLPAGTSPALQLSYLHSTALSPTLTFTYTCTVSYLVHTAYTAPSRTA